MTTSSMNHYLPYVERLEQLVASFRSDGEWAKAADLALNGQPSRELRHSVCLATLRSEGTFFTGTHLANRLVGTSRSPKNGRSVYLDPTCGAGDLLLAVARGLPIKHTLNDTLAYWGESLAGMDKHDEFIRATKARMAILAMSRGAIPDLGRPPNLEETLPMIRAGDALTDCTFYASADKVLLNPPYYITTVPADCAWATGKVTAAALFVEKVIKEARTGTVLSAILPDVLRSGSRYQAWRETIRDLASVDRVQVYGLFDTSADVDVFMLDLRVSKTTSRKPWPRVNRAIQPANGSVGTFFDIHVGPIVPHRDRQKGPMYPYIHARNLPRWCSYAPGSEKRRFDGRTFIPPFVVVRRTSRPGDLKRATATVIKGKQAIAIENHLLVLTPHDGKLKICSALLKRLHSNETDKWLNRRIRCRHLTVKAMAELPWWRKV